MAILAFGRWFVQGRVGFDGYYKRVKKHRYAAIKQHSGVAILHHHSFSEEEECYVMCQPQQRQRSELRECKCGL